MAKMDEESSELAPRSTAVEHSSSWHSSSTPRSTTVEHAPQRITIRAVEHSSSWHSSSTPRSTTVEHAPQRITIRKQTSPLENKIGISSISSFFSSSSGSSGNKSRRPPRLSSQSCESYCIDSTSWIVGMRDGLKMTLDTLTEEQLQHEPDGKTGCLGGCWPRLVLCLFPVLQPFRVLGFSYAWNRNEFIPVLSPLLTSMVLMLLTFVAMLLAMGVGSLRLLLSPRYFWYILPAVFYVAWLVLENNALTLIHPTVATILMQSSTFTTALLQYLCFQRLPHLAQATSLVGINLLVVAYILGGETSEGQGTSIRGISMSIVAACCRSVFSIAMEHVFLMMQQRTDDPGDRLRGMISLEFWKMLLFAPCLFTDWSFIQVNGVFHGWDWWTFLTAVVPGVAISAAQAVLYPSMGALRTNIAATLGIVVVYLFQSTVLKMGNFHMSELLLLSGIIMVVLTFNMSFVDAARAESNVRLSMISAVTQSRSFDRKAELSKDKVSGLRQGMRVKDRGTQFPETQGAMWV